jgi:GDP-4-dehydro-6-deoxy-D-mannose reductase
MTLLVTGASGFVGHYVRRLIGGVPFDDNGKEVDLRDAAHVRSALERIRPERVIHLAAQSAVPAAFEHPLETMEVNFIGTLHLLTALRDTGFRGRMLYIGSGDVYGVVPEAQLPITEDQPLKPRNPYAVSKVAAEALCYQWSQTEGFEIVLTRPFNHVGPGQGRRFAVSDFAAQIAEIGQGRREPVLRVGDVDVTRDYTDVRDVVRAYGLLLEQGRNGEVYNVCSGRERVIRSVIESLFALAGVRAEIVAEPQRMRPNEQRRTQASNRKLNQAVGWAPEIPWERTLGDLLAYWKEHAHG